MKTPLPNTHDDKLLCLPENAERYKKWIAERGGLALWVSVCIGEPPQSWVTPVRHEDGSEVRAPNWRCGNAGPAAIFLREDEVLVETLKEIARYEDLYRADGRLSRAFRAWFEDLEDIHPDCFWECHDGDAVVFLRDKIIPLNEYSP